MIGSGESGSNASAVDMSVDFRSDTVTQPCEGMRLALSQAVVGDDVLGDDPTVTALETRIASLLGKEAAIFVPSGTMANAIAIAAVCQKGEEVVVERNAHIYLYEAGGYASIAGASVALVPSSNDCGILTPEDVEKSIRDFEHGMSHFPRTRMVCIENSHNRGSGSVYTAAQVNAIGEVCQRHSLHFHCDGARLWNAAAAAVNEGVSLQALVEKCDTVSVCLSKGLGAPVGSVLVGKRDLIRGRAHQIRKMLGGGMRQSGVLAAAGLYALEHNLPRISHTHTQLQRIATYLHSHSLSLFAVNLSTIQTNLLYATLKTQKCKPETSAHTVQRFCLERFGVKLLAISDDRIRIVTHIQITDEGVERCINALEEFAREFAA